MMKHTFAIALAASVSSTAFAYQSEKPAAADKPAPAAEKKPAKEMTIGDKAMPIDISHWIKYAPKDGKAVTEGKPVTNFEDGKVYVLEFWATWCGPCRAGMPHLTEMQEKYQDYGVAIIGISDEPLETVTKFLTSEDTKEKRLWTDKIGYTLTTDPDESVKNDYFTAAGQNGIPCAFIIGKDQHVEWIGHPMSMDEPLKAVVNDEWDRAAFKARWQKEQAAEKDYMDFMRLLLRENKPVEAYEVGQRVVEANWDNAEMLNQIAWTVVDSPAVKQRDLGFATKAAERANDLESGKNAAVLDTLARCYFEKGDLAKAVDTQKKAVALNAEGDMGEEIAATLKKYEEALAKKGS